MRLRFLPMDSTSAIADPATWLRNQARDWILAGGEQVIVVSGGGLTRAAFLADRIERATARRATAPITPLRIAGVYHSALTSSTLLVWDRFHHTRMGIGVVLLEVAASSDCDLAIDSPQPSWLQIGEPW